MGHFPFQARNLFPQNEPSRGQNPDYGFIYSLFKEPVFPHQIQLRNDHFSLLVENRLRLRLRQELFNYNPLPVGNELYLGLNLDLFLFAPAHGSNTL